tara:strand:- start:552 stop:857 length:306 start_codon:yes stop_codon:yes gene_type:complete
MKRESMIKKLFLILTLGVTVSGCFMAPLAFIGPATSGFSTASVLQSGVSAGANYMVKKSTGKTISEHALSVIDNKDVYQQSYFPTYETSIRKIFPKSKPIR